MFTPVPNLCAQLVALRDDETGATAIEYGLLASLIAIASVQALDSLGTALKDTFETTSDTLANDAPPPAADEPSEASDTI